MDAEKGRKRVHGRKMEAETSQGRSKALPATQNVSHKSSTGTKNKEVGGSLNLASSFSGK